MIEKVKSYAKINLHLAVGPKRDDGYHSIQSIFAKIDLYDLLTIDAVVNDKIEIKVYGLENCELSKEDTITKAARLWCEKTNINLKININVEKNIPIKAGLGGGSSNAAYTLLTLNKMFNDYALQREDLLSLALNVGSDVPFFLYDTTFAYVEGQGEQIYPIECSFDYDIILIKPNVGISTKGAFDKLDKIDRDNFKSKEQIIEEFKLGIDSWYKNFYNDFELVVESKILSDINKKGSFFAHLSGSGSTCFVIYNKNKYCYNMFTFFRKFKHKNYYKSCFFLNI